jgi:hypothetical protein
VGDADEGDLPKVKHGEEESSESGFEVCMIEVAV